VASVQNLAIIKANPTATCRELSTLTGMSKSWCAELQRTVKSIDISDTRVVITKVA
jgi:hypothetical protein